MADLNILGQAAAATTAAPRLAAFRGELDKRLVIWNRLTDDQKRMWIRSGKDPLMTLAWQTYKYLSQFFGSADDGTV
jgi:hypothetical protein